MTDLAVLPALLAGGALAVLAVPASGTQRLVTLTGTSERSRQRSPRRPGLAALRRPGLPLAAALLALLLGGPALAVLAVVAERVVTRQLQRRRVQADRGRERRRAVEACSALAAELRAGRTPG